MKTLFRNFNNKSNFGLAINWNFHLQNKWVSAYTPYLVKAIVGEFDPIILDTQLSYTLNKNKLKYIISFEPGISAPKIKYDLTHKCKKGIIYSDPHYKSKERFEYFVNNNFDYVFSLYKSSFFKHFKGFPEEKFVHWPWAVPDKLISSHSVQVRSNEVAIFGGTKSDAYDIRNWCREQSGVTNYELSGVENKKLDDAEFYRWLADFDAIVAAGSSNPDYDLATPKYFEIAAAGALLIGQHCLDLHDLGFDESNSVIFRKDNFVEKIKEYRQCPEAYLDKRISGRELIKKRHKLSDRMRCLHTVYFGK